MEKELIAHVRRDRSTGEVIATQSLKEHSGNVAVFCSENCRVANLSKAGKVAGLQHDGGKSSRKKARSDPVYPEHKKSTAYP